MNSSIKYTIQNEIISTIDIPMEIYLFLSEWYDDIVYEHWKQHKNHWYRDHSTYFKICSSHTHKEEFNHTVRTTKTKRDGLAGYLNIKKYTTVHSFVWTFTHGKNKILTHYTGHDTPQNNTPFLEKIIKWANREYKRWMYTCVQERVSKYRVKHDIHKYALYKIKKQQRAKHGRRHSSEDIRTC